MQHVSLRRGRHLHLHKVLTSSNLADKNDDDDGDDDDDSNDDDNEGVDGLGTSPLAQSTYSI